MEKKISSKRFPLIGVVMLASSLASAQPEKVNLQLIGIGLEQIEDGKLATSRELWKLLECEGSGATATCELHALIVKGCLLGSPWIAQGKPPVTVRDLDHEAGVLDMKIMYDEEPSECRVTFKKKKRVEQRPLSSSHDVRSVSCQSVHRNLDGTITTIEARMPAKSYEWRPPCGYWLKGADNKEPPQP